MANQDQEGETTLTQHPHDLCKIFEDKSPLLEWKLQINFEREKIKLALSLKHSIEGSFHLSDYDGACVCGRFFPSFDDPKRNFDVQLDRFHLVLNEKGLDIHAMSSSNHDFISAQHPQFPALIADLRTKLESVFNKV